MGSLFFDIQEVAGTETELTTPTAVAAIRGTEGSQLVPNDTQSTHALNEGLQEVTEIITGQTVTITGGQFVVALRGIGFGPIGVLAAAVAQATVGGGAGGGGAVGAGAGGGAGGGGAAGGGAAGGGAAGGGAAGAAGAATGAAAGAATSTVSAVATAAVAAGTAAGGTLVIREVTKTVEPEAASASAPLLGPGVN